jgi:predicted MFS family arabinose efflux permease
MSSPLAPTYRDLFAVPSLGRMLLGSTLARTAAAMVPVALVLFALRRYDSPALAGAVTFASIFPGLALSPLAGALLDRHGRTRLVVLDYVICGLSLLLIAALAALERLPAPVLVGIAAVAATTNILSHTGLRSLFPLIVPERLWERVNAVDSNGYVVATLLGPPLAGALVQLGGGPAAFVAITLLYAAAALILLGVADPPLEPATRGRLHLDAWDGLRYTWSNPVLRGLAFSLSTLNLGLGGITVVMPVMVLRGLGRDEATVGVVFAAQGLAGMAAALVVGRWDTAGRERLLIAVPIALTAVALAVLLLPLGLPGVFAAFALVGLLNGPLDVAMFTLRQRRTDPAWMGRAFAVSMAMNYAGYPVGSFVGGVLVERSHALAVGFCVAASALGALLAWRLLPRSA